MKSKWYIVVGVIVVIAVIGVYAYVQTTQSTATVSYTVGTIVLNNDDYFSELYLLGNQVATPKGATVTPFSGNTGAVQSALASGSIDMGIAGQTMIAALCASPPAAIKIVSDQVDINHQWALFVKNTSTFTNLSQLKGSDLGVSRVGSEGYSLLIYEATLQNWTSSQYKYTAVGGLTALVAAVNSGSISGFYWDTSTTGPLVQQGLIKQIQTVNYPGAFSVVMATDSFISQHPTQIKQFLSTLGSDGSYWNSNENTAVSILMKNYNMSQSAAQQAYSSFSVLTHPVINMTLLQQTLKFEQISGVCPSNFDLSSTYTTQFASVVS